jgi:hypothetical protein
MDKNRQASSHFNPTNHLAALTFHPTVVLDIPLAGAVLATILHTGLPWGRTSGADRKTESSKVA